MSSWFQNSKESKPPKEILVLKNYEEERLRKEAEVARRSRPRSKSASRRGSRTTEGDEAVSTQRRARSKSASRRGSRTTEGEGGSTPQRRARSKSASRRDSRTTEGDAGLVGMRIVTTNSRDSSAHSRGQTMGTVSPRREPSSHRRGRTLSLSIHGSNHNEKGPPPTNYRSKSLSRAGSSRSLNRTPSSKSLGKNTRGSERMGLLRSLSGRFGRDRSRGRSRGRSASRSDSGQSSMDSVDDDNSRGRSLSTSKHNGDMNRSRSRSRSRGRTLSGGGTDESSPAAKTPNNSDTRSSAISVGTPGSGKKKQPPKTVCCGETSTWHGAVTRQDWATLERLLKAYDHRKYKDQMKQRQPREHDQKKKPQRRLRMMKYFSKGGANSNNSTPANQTYDGGDEDEEDDFDDSVSPLLQVDTQGRTPLHYACKDPRIPQKLLQRLLFSERDAAFVPDQDGRIPLHVAMLFQSNTQVLDKLIRANPQGLIHQDCLHQTPMVYAIRQAIHQRDRRTSGVVTWRIPTTATQAEWHSSQTAKWSKVKFVLDIFESRRMAFTRRQAEGDLILESLESLAPPTIIVQLLQHSKKYLASQELDDNDENENPIEAVNQANEARSMKVLLKLCRFHYPMTCIHTLLKILGHKNLPPQFRKVMRQGYIEHYKEGCLDIQRQPDAGMTETSDGADDESFASSIGSSSFRAELLLTHRQRQMGNNIVATLPCQEWWTKLRFFIKTCCPQIKPGQKLLDDYILHAALTIPETPPSLVELLVRLMPYARYEVDPVTDALPIHLACRYWIGSDGNELKKLTSGNSINKVGSDEMEPTVEMVLNLLLAGDFSLAWKRYKSRLPLHHAIVGAKPLSVLQTLIALDKKTANSRDPVTKLYPFQLASTARDSAGKTAALKELARSKPFVDIGTATSGKGGSQKKHLRRMYELDHLGNIYELLRACPSAISPTIRRGDLNLPPGAVGPVANHFLEWFYHYKLRSSGSGTLVVDKTRMNLIRDAVATGEVTGQLLQWWNQMKFWIWQTYENPTSSARGIQIKSTKLPNQDDYLLHAALFIEETPPIVIELLLELQPHSVSKPIPGTHIFPLHIAAATPAYSPLPFEKTMSMGSAIDMLLIMYHQAAHVEYNKRLPLHIAIAAGKAWKEVKPLAENNPTSLSVPDPLSGLFPFQLLAARHTSVPLHQVIAMETRLVDWNDMIIASSLSSPHSSGGGGASNGCANLISSIRRDHELQILSSVFEVLTRKPEALEACLRR